MLDMCEQLVPPRSVAVCTLTDSFSWRHENCYPVFGVYIDCKTVGFFLKISKEIGKAWGKSLTPAKRASLPEAREKKPSLPSLALCFQPRSTPFV